jgi:hypothetical protein
MNNERDLYFVRNQAGRSVAPLVPGSPARHPPWVHEQLGTVSEDELAALADSLRLADYLRRGRDNQDRRGIFVDIPSGALAWKRKDPFQDARWLFDDSEVVEALELDPELVVRVAGTEDE